jgi:hypothetical protein
MTPTRLRLMSIRECRTFKFRSYFQNISALLQGFDAPPVKQFAQRPDPH